jgi:Fic family protein
MKYNWQQIDWPNFSFNTAKIDHLLLDFIRNSGKLEGALETLTENNQSETIIELLVIEAIKTSEIEGEYLSRKDVASSIRKNLGLLKTTENIKDQKARGIAELLIMVRNSYYKPLAKKELLNWHKSLMSHDPTIQSGEWREHEEPMQIISGALGKEKIHLKRHRQKMSLKKWNNSFNGLMVQRRINPMKSYMHQFGLQLHIFILKVFIRLKMEMDVLVEHLQKKLWHKL